MQGMYITMRNMIRPKVTEQYPENRGKHVYFERFRAELTMPHDADNHHKCTACGICQMNCPNGTIEVISKTITDEATGRPKKVLDRYVYNIGSCIFCSLCTQTCPQDAIEWSNNFEHSTFTLTPLYKQLNHEGSSLKPKPAPALKPAAPKAEGEAAAQPAKPVVEKQPAAESKPEPAVEKPEAVASKPVVEQSKPAATDSAPAAESAPKAEAAVKAASTEPAGSGDSKEVKTAAGSEPSATKE